MGLAGGWIQPALTQWTASVQFSHYLIACSTPGFPITNSWSLLKLTSIESAMPSNHHPLSSPSPSIFPSIRVFSNESALCIRCPKYWSFSFSINPFNEYSGLISFRMDWFDSLAVQGTLKSLLQHHTSKASILQRSAFFIVHFSHPYMTTGKTMKGKMVVWGALQIAMTKLDSILKSRDITLPTKFCLVKAMVFLGVM